MAVSSSALTLAQYAIMSNDPLIQQITYSLLENANVLNDLPLVTKKSILVNGVRWEGSLPSVNWSKLNVDPVVTSGTPAAYQEQAYIIRNAIDVDRFLVEDENQIQNPRGVQTNAYLKSVAYDVNDKFINNDHLTGNNDAFHGLRNRIDNAVFRTNSDCKIDTSGVDLSPGGMTLTTANTFIEYIQQLLDMMGAPTGMGVTLYMNDLMKRRFARAVRMMGPAAGWSVNQDNFGRPVEMYNDAKIRDIGRKADQTTKIITSTELNTGGAGSSTFTSIYGVRYGEDHVFGWQFDALSPKDIGLIGNGGSTYRMLIDWAFGIFQTGTRDIARLYDIKVS